MRSLVLESPLKRLRWCEKFVSNVDMEHHDYLSLLIYFLGTLAVCGVMLASYFLGNRHKERATEEPFESGIVSTGDARVRFGVHFYVIAMLFVVFDLESVFLYLWAAAASTLGAAVFGQIALFVAILMAVLLYLWRAGAFLGVASRKD